MSLDSSINYESVLAPDTLSISTGKVPLLIDPRREVDASEHASVSVCALSGIVLWLRLLYRNTVLTVSSSLVEAVRTVLFLHLIGPSPQLDDACDMHADGTYRLEPSGDVI